MKEYMVPTAEIIDFEHDYVAAAGSAGNGRGHTGGGGGTNSLLDEINQIDQIGDLH